MPRDVIFFDRHYVVASNHLPEWIAVANDINTASIPELHKLTKSERQARVIGLRGTDEPAARRAVEKLKSVDESC